MIPVSLEISGNSLMVRWSDSVVTAIKLTNLRRNCPCAVCGAEYEKKGSGYLPLYKQEEVTVKDIIPAGSYAVNIVWADGHNAGFYIYDLLKKLGDM